MSKKFTPPTFPSTEKVGSKFLDPEFFKKQSKIKDEDLLSLDQRNRMFQNVKAYNTFYGTHFFVVYQLAGESCLYQLKEVRTGNKVEVVALFKDTPKSATFAQRVKAEVKQGIQKLLFSIDEFTVQKPAKLRPGKPNFREVSFTNH